MPSQCSIVASAKLREEFVSRCHEKPIERTRSEAGEWTIAVKSPYCVTELAPTTIAAKAMAPDS